MLSIHEEPSVKTTPRPYQREMSAAQSRSALALSITRLNEFYGRLDQVDDLEIIE